MKHTLRQLRLRAPHIASAGWLLFASALLVTRDASALEVEGGLKLGGATKPGFATSTTPYGFGLGARAGLSAFHVYLGVAATAYFGGSFEAPSQAAGHVKIGWSSTLIGGELGTTFRPLRYLVLRPQLGIGDASFSVTIDGTPLKSANAGYPFPDHADHLYFEPNLTALIPIMDQFYVGGDFGALVTVVGRPYPAFTAHVQAGAFF